MPEITFEQVADLASRLPPTEQLKLVAEIGERIRHELPQTLSRRYSADAILDAVRQPPHLDAADVDELERAIAAGRLPIKQEGIFDPGGGE
ncbi:MAG: hypothetical protein GXY83_24225 [Rhodopirellula sp.]|nr:hypothetical protein [Rhodopirellula sp.]